MIGFKIEKKNWSKAFLLLATLPILFIGCSATENLPEAVPETSVSVEYDRYDDHTVFQSSNARVYAGEEQWDGLIGGGSNFHHRIHIGASVYCEGDVESCDPDNATIVFLSRSTDGWKLLRRHRMNFIVDGDRFELEETDSDRETLGGSRVSEAFAFTVDFEVFEEIAFGDEVEARLGEYELNLSEERRKPLRNLYHRLN